MNLIGPRLWKTGLAVALTLFLVRLTGQPYEVFGAVAAALAVAPSASRSLRTMAGQVSAHLPPDYQAATMAAIDRAGASLDQFVLEITGRLAQPHATERATEYPVQLPELQAALTELVAYRKALYTMLLRADPVRALPVALAELEHRFESPGGLPASQEQVEPFFRLYRMRSSVSHMANRLGRLYVAKEAALPPVLTDAELAERVLVS